MAQTTRAGRARIVMRRHDPVVLRLLSSPSQLQKALTNEFAEPQPEKINIKMATNRAAYLDEAGKLLRVGDAQMPKPGPDDIVVK